jgi:hypothetical protein
MTSIESLLTRAKKLHGINDDALEVEWNNMLDMEVESLMADLEDKIARMTPEELEAEEQNKMSPSEFEQLEKELTAALAEGEGDIKKYWFAQQRKKRRRGRR